MKLFHRWGSWSEPIDTNYDYKKVQSRYCLDCNKYQVKKISQPWNTWFGASLLRKAQEK